MRRNGHVWRVPDDLVRHTPLPVRRVALGEVQRAGNNAHTWVFDCQAPTEVLEMCPVVPVEALADLRAHVGQEEGLVQCLLAPFGVRRGYLVAPVVAGAKIIFELRAELFRYRRVLDEDGVPPVSIRLREGLASDMFSDPGRVS